MAEFEAEFERLQHERHPYVITTQPYEFKAGTMLEARAELPEVYRDDVAAVVGDIVFNARSALDNLPLRCPVGERPIPIPGPRDGPVGRLRRPRS